MGMFYADEIVYIFQSSSELLQIPRLPIKLDFDEVIANNLQIFRLLGNNLPVNKADCQNIPETLLFSLEGEENVTLSEWGTLIWSQVKSDYYAQGLLEPLNNQVVYSDEFKDDIQQLQRTQPKRVREVNIRCDQLCIYLESNLQIHLKAFDFKKLKDNGFRNSTHECDAWADGDARRIFGHFNNDGTYTIDCLAKGLHY